MQYELERDNIDQKLKEKPSGPPLELEAPLRWPPDQPDKVSLTPLATCLNYAASSLCIIHKENIELLSAIVIKVGQQGRVLFLDMIFYKLSGEQKRITLFGSIIFKEKWLHTEIYIEITVGKKFWR